MQAGLYRIMAQDGVSLNTVNTKNGDTSVLNLKVVKYWTPEDKASPWHKVTLWGDQAERYIEHISHNQAVFLEGDLEFESYDQTFTLEDGSEKVVSRITPSFRRITDFRLVNVIKTPRAEDSSSASSEDEITQKATAAAKSKTTKSTSDKAPF